jgi:hypothetical protein
MKLVVPFVVLFSMVGLAQEAAAPTMDKDLVDSWKREMALQENVVADKSQALIDAAKRAGLPEFQGFERSRQELLQRRDTIKAAAEKKFAGYTLDFTTWTLSPKKTK